MKRNGFLTFYVLCLGIPLLTVAVLTASLAAYCMKSARQYAEMAQLSYGAESAAALAWHDLSNRSWQDIPAKEKWRLTDEYGFLEKGQYAEVQCVSSPYELPFKGTVRAAAVAEKSLAQRTCAITFEVRADEENTARFFIQKIMY